MIDTTHDGLYHGDCLDVMRKMPDNSIQLIATDPPYNTGKDFGAYNDKIPDYLEFLQKRLLECHRVLKDNGSIYLQCDTRFNHRIRCILDDVFGSKNFRNEIVWCYRSPSSPNMKQFPKKHGIIIWYSKGKKWIFNNNDMRVPYAPSSIARAKYGHCTDLVTSQGGEMVLCDNGKLLEDWWDDISTVGHNKKEITGYPTQKPLKLCKRIIQASSNIDDIVLDPFCSSGTTLVAAHKLNRRYIGIDINDNRELVRGRLGY